VARRDVALADHHSHWGRQPGARSCRRARDVASERAKSWRSSADEVWYLAWKPPLVGERLAI
jgi:hypothetical protein